MPQHAPTAQGTVRGPYGREIQPNCRLSQVGACPKFGPPGPSYDQYDYYGGDDDFEPDCIIFTAGCFPANPKRAHCPVKNCGSRLIYRPRPCQLLLRLTGDDNSPADAHPVGSEGPAAPQQPATRSPPGPRRGRSKEKTDKLDDDDIEAMLGGPLGLPL